jgi:hypothetical protein
MMKRDLLFLLAIALVACGGKKDDPAAGASGASQSPSPAAVPRPASLRDDQIANIDKLVATLADIGSKVRGKDCPASTEVLRAAAPQLDELSGSLDGVANGDPQMGAWFKANYKDRLRAAMDPLMATVMRCSSDPAFAGALEHVPFVKKKHAS